MNDMGGVYYKLLKSDERITVDQYRQRLIKTNRALTEKRPEYALGHHKVIFTMITLGPMLQNA